MNKVSVIFAIIALTISVIGSSSFTSVLAKGKLTMGPVNCEALTDETIRCCATETGSDGIEIKWCTMCANTNPPSNCSPREMWNPESSPNPPSTSGKDIDKDQILPPSKSNEGTSQNNGLNPQQALTTSKSN